MSEPPIDLDQPLSKPPDIPSERAYFEEQERKIAAEEERIAHLPYPGETPADDGEFL